jgi:hypothetical protein
MNESIIIYGELERIGREMVMAHFKELFNNTLEGNQENY